MRPGRTAFACHIMCVPTDSPTEWETATLVPPKDCLETGVSVLLPAPYQTFPLSNPPAFGSNRAESGHIRSIPHLHNIGQAPAHAPVQRPPVCCAAQTKPAGTSHDLHRHPPGSKVPHGWFPSKSLLPVPLFHISEKVFAEKITAFRSAHPGTVQNLVTVEYSARSPAALRSAAQR